MDSNVSRSLFLLPSDSMNKVVGEFISFTATVVSPSSCDRLASGDAPHEIANSQYGAEQVSDQRNRKCPRGIRKRRRSLGREFCQARCVPLLDRLGVMRS